MQSLWTRSQPFISQNSQSRNPTFTHKIPPASATPNQIHTKSISLLSAFFPTPSRPTQSFFLLDMKRVTASPSLLPSSDVASYDSWEEVNISVDKGRRKVHYYLKRKDGGLDLAVIGKEKNLRHMRYRLAIRNRPVFASPASFGKLKSRREVIDWLSSVVSGKYCVRQFSVFGILRILRIRWFFH